MSNVVKAAFGRPKATFRPAFLGFDRSTHVEVENRAALVAHIQKLMGRKVAAKDVSVKSYGWDRCIVMVADYGVVGFTDIALES